LAVRFAAAPRLRHLTRVETRVQQPSSDLSSSAVPVPQLHYHANIGAKFECKYLPRFIYMICTRADSIGVNLTSSSMVDYANLSSSGRHPTSDVYYTEYNPIQTAAHQPTCAHPLSSDYIALGRLQRQRFHVVQQRAPNKKKSRCVDVTEISLNPLAHSQPAALPKFQGK
jgi:hypothetical protein